MRHLWIALVVFVAACESKVESPQLPLADGKAELSKAMSAPPITKVLTASLPGDVKLDFPHDIVMETNREVAGVQSRMVMIEPKVPVQQAIAALTKGFEGAGFKSSQGNEHTVGFSKGGTGEGMMAISSGGTHVALTFNDYKPDNPRVKEGFSGMINMTINSGVQK